VGPRDDSLVALEEIDALLVEVVVGGDVVLELRLLQPVDEVESAGNCHTEPVACRNFGRMLMIGRRHEV
jgi:hypothetical protein